MLRKLIAAALKEDRGKNVPFEGGEHADTPCRDKQAKTTEGIVRRRLEKRAKVMWLRIDVYEGARNTAHRESQRKT